MVDSIILILLRGLGQIMVREYVGFTIMTTNYRPKINKETETRKEPNSEKMNYVS